MNGKWERMEKEWKKWKEHAQWRTFSGIRTSEAPSAPHPLIHYAQQTNFGDWGLRMTRQPQATLNQQTNHGDWGKPPAALTLFCNFVVGSVLRFDFRFYLPFNIWQLLFLPQMSWDNSFGDLYRTCSTSNTPLYPLKGSLDLIRDTSSSDGPIFSH